MHLARIFCWFNLYAFFWAVHWYFLFVYRLPIEWYGKDLCVLLPFLMTQNNTFVLHFISFQMLIPAHRKTSDIFHSFKTNLNEWMKLKSRKQKTRKPKKKNISQSAILFGLFEMIVIAHFEWLQRIYDNKNTLILNVCACIFFFTIFFFLDTITEMAQIKCELQQSEKNKL